jgi:PLP dependent protein
MRTETEQASEATEVAANLADVKQRIALACTAAGRNALDVTLIAVAKAQPLARVEAALLAGQRAFGENYVQEAAGRWPLLRSSHAAVELHLIGALQTNKAADAVRLFDVIQTLDRPRLAQALAREFDRQGVRRRLFVEVNTGEEQQKAGLRPDELDSFIERCRREFGLELDGLMAIPPAEEDLSLHAALLGKLARRNGLKAVSVGMSADYEIACRFGATHVRVGTAIFGERAPRPGRAD